MAAQPEIDARVDAYILKAPEFAQPILERIRASFHAGCPDLKENIKWGVPAFERNGLLGGMAFFKAHVSYGFWRSGEMEDPLGWLGKERKASFMSLKVASVKELPTKAALTKYVKEARRVDQEVPKNAPKKSKSAAPKAPAVMTKAIGQNKQAAAFWKGLTPGYRKEYVEWVTEAKREATQEKRLAQTVEWLAEGKTKNWKYKDC